MWGWNEHNDVIEGAARRREDATFLNVVLSELRVSLERQRSARKGKGLFTPNQSGSEGEEDQDQ